MSYNVRVFSATPDDVANFSRSAVPLEDAFDDIDSEVRLNPDTPIGFLILPADVSKDDALAILDELRKLIEEPRRR